ncbi:PLP-dependent aminotransferase family protein [Bradyrhizobium sp. SYSU BS000235]|uniref:MocR-like pyridoxine biosynthesis transcription factor PdxR n=1 Tax=Bradyrhizobium sp. SYSU BS000235 TaxID=3411332 RepID=UPI003C72D1BC
MASLSIAIDRSRKIPLADQIYRAIREAIESGRFASGARLPSWRDLAAQLGVSRGTVRVAYERLIAEQFAIGLGASGTRVAERPAQSTGAASPTDASPLPNIFYYDFGTRPLPFQMGVPAQDGFPIKLWSRVLTREVRQAVMAPVSYPDPRGEPGLRQEIAAYLAIARGIRCSPSQVFITGGFSGALGLVIQGLQLQKATAWIEEPGFPLTRTALDLAGITVKAIPVDADGLDVAAGERVAADAALAIVTPGQQAPLGMTMSLARRLALLEWAKRNGAWIVEDDYLSELQLTGRAAPALASLDDGGRVLHVGSFSKTLSPTLRLGFMVVPQELVRRFGDVAACLAPAPAAGVQRAVAELMREGCYLRHLRHMKRLYSARKEALLRSLGKVARDTVKVKATAGLAVVVELPGSVSDRDVALRALPFGLAPSALSSWYTQPVKQRGLLLGVTNIHEDRVLADCKRLIELVR